MRSYTVVITYQHNGNKSYERSAAVVQAATSARTAVAKGLERAKRSGQLQHFREKENVPIRIVVTPGPKISKEVSK